MRLVHDRAGRVALDRRGKIPAIARRRPPNFWLPIALGTLFAAAGAVAVGIAMASDPTVTARGWTLYPPATADVSGSEGWSDNQLLALGTVLASAAAVAFAVAMRVRRRVSN